MSRGGDGLPWSSGSTPPVAPTLRWTGRAPRRRPEDPVTHRACLHPADARRRPLRRHAEDRRPLHGPDSGRVDAARCGGPRPLGRLRHRRVDPTAAGNAGPGPARRSRGCAAPRPGQPRSVRSARPAGPIGLHPGRRARLLPGRRRPTLPGRGRLRLLTAPRGRGCRRYRLVHGRSRVRVPGRPATRHPPHRGARLGPGPTRRSRGDFRSPGRGRAAGPQSPRPRSRPLAIRIPQHPGRRRARARRSRSRARHPIPWCGPARRRVPRPRSHPGHGARLGQPIRPAPRPQPGRRHPPRHRAASAPTRRKRRTSGPRT